MQCNEHCHAIFENDLTMQTSPARYTLSENWTKPIVHVPNLPTAHGTEALFIFISILIVYQSMTFIYAPLYHTGGVQSASQ